MGGLKMKKSAIKISEKKALELLKELENGGILLTDEQPAFPLKVKA